ncbi:glycine betaine ABC transporter substrate-binding protein [Rhodoligotrophos defluvii]|uniref:glycine betaine ABC transporter substrate-binding protein n=1 Tax=Rhodoligotrophos defluvii TaxID=2561934 RepID=UPI0010C9AF90
MLTRRSTLLGAAGLALATMVAGGPAAALEDVTIAYVEWSDAVVATNIIKTVLEQEGYNVKTVPLSAAAMWQAVASGEADAMVAAWLPATHQAYFEKLKDQVVDLGPNVTGAKIGWAVPTYVEDVNSMEDLKNKAAEFKGQVIGIDPGAGLMKASEKAIQEYDLPLKLIEGSDATMVAALKDAYNRKEPIIVTTWTPHWMHSSFDLKYLEDPKGVFGSEETVNTVVRKGLKEDDPKLYAILDNFALSLDQEQAVMLENEQPGANPAETAKKWVEANKSTVESWVP